MKSRRHAYRRPDLTSLFDVLFIIIFASLIRAAAAEKAVADALAPPPVPALPVRPATPPDIAALRTRALADLDQQLATRTPLVIRISANGIVEAIEADGKRIALDVPLLEHSPDPDVAIAYLGDRSAELRLCRVALVHLAVTELASYLVIVAPAVPLADLPHALHEGLHRDLDRCFAEQRGLATIVDPAALTNQPDPPAHP
ncbi:hypothetical protein BH11MYX3_BH11MYX3_01120 [soil metagenome]